MAYPTAFVVDQANVNSGGQLVAAPQRHRAVQARRSGSPTSSWCSAATTTTTAKRPRLSQVGSSFTAATRSHLYQSGTIDVSYVGGDYMGLVTDPTNPISKELHVFPELSIYYIGFNAAAPPFDDANVRQAFSYAVDKDRLITLATENVVVPAYGILPPDMPGYNPTLAGLRFDPQKAKQLIAASKYGDVSKLPPIVLTTSGYGGDISGLIGGVIEEWRRNLGVEVTVRQIQSRVLPLHPETGEEQPLRYRLDRRLPRPAGLPGYALPHRRRRTTPATTATRSSTRCWTGPPSSRTGKPGWACTSRPSRWSSRTRPSCRSSSGAPTCSSSRTSRATSSARWAIRS